MSEAPKFVMSSAKDADNQIQAVQKVAQVETYLVQYKDGEGRSQTRMVFQIPNTKSIFILQERIQGQHVATAASPWFQEEFVKTLKGENEGTDNVESI